VISVASVSFVRLFVHALLELSTPRSERYSPWQDLGMHGSWGQKVKGQILTLTLEFFSITLELDYAWGWGCIVA